MAEVSEHTEERMVLRSGGTTLTLDRKAGKATLQRKLLFWSLKPAELALEEIAAVTIDAGVDRASGIDVCNTMLVTRGGAAWALPGSDKADVERTAAALRAFLHLGE
jgi:hypothetical protein